MSKAVQRQEQMHPLHDKAFLLWPLCPIGYNGHVPEGNIPDHRDQTAQLTCHYFHQGLQSASFAHIPQKQVCSNEDKHNEITIHTQILVPPLQDLAGYFEG